MRTIGTTVVFQTIDQDSIIRESQSNAHLYRELHKVTTDGSGDGTLYTSIDKIVGSSSGIDGTTNADCAAVDFDGGVFSTTDEQYAVPVKGAASTVYSIIIYGYHVGN